MKDYKTAIAKLFFLYSAYIFATYMYMQMECKKKESITKVLPNYRFVTDLIHS